MGRIFSQQNGLIIVSENKHFDLIVNFSDSQTLSRELLFFEPKFLHLTQTQAHKIRRVDVFFSKTKPLGSYFTSPHRTFTLFKFVFPLRNSQTSDVHLQSSFKCSFPLATITCTSHSGQYAQCVSRNSQSQLLVWF